MVLSVSLRQQVRSRADERCEYYHSPEKVSAARFEIDHIHPRSLGGFDDLDNLALACQRCNANRYNFIQATDPLTQLQVPLFHPRANQWAEHFQWSHDGCYILGVTAIGRATVSRLELIETIVDISSQLCIRHQYRINQPNRFFFQRSIRFLG